MLPVRTRLATARARLVFSDFSNFRYSKFPLFRMSEFLPNFRFTEYPIFRFSVFPIFGISKFPNFRFFDFLIFQFCNFPIFSNCCVSFYLEESPLSKWCCVNVGCYQTASISYSVISLRLVRSPERQKYTRYPAFYFRKSSQFFSDSYMRATTTVTSQKRQHYQDIP